MEGMHIMIIEDDQSLARELADFLSKWGYHVSTTKDFEDIVCQVIAKEPDLVLMDINLPYYDGFYWCVKIREFSKVPIMYISSRHRDSDKIMAISRGGDDYIEKPFQLDLLKAKIEALLRRTYQYKIDKKTYIQQDIYYDTQRSSLYYKNQTIELTKSENIIFKTLLEHRPHTVSRNVLMMISSCFSVKSIAGVMSTSLVSINIISVAVILVILMICYGLSVMIYVKTVCIGNYR